MRIVMFSELNIKPTKKKNRSNKFPRFEPAKVHRLLSLNLRATNDSSPNSSDSHVYPSPWFQYRFPAAPFASAGQRKQIVSDFQLALGRQISTWYSQSPRSSVRANRAPDLVSGQSARFWSVSDRGLPATPVWGLTPSYAASRLQRRRRKTAFSVRFLNNLSRGIEKRRKREWRTECGRNRTRLRNIAMTFSNRWIVHKRVASPCKPTGTCSSDASDKTAHGSPNSLACFQYAETSDLGTWTCTSSHRYDNTSCGCKIGYFSKPRPPGAFLLTTGTLIVWVSSACFNCPV